MIKLILPQQPIDQCGPVVYKSADLKMYRILFHSFLLSIWFSLNRSTKHYPTLTLEIRLWSLRFLTVDKYKRTK